MAGVEYTEMHRRRCRVGEEERGKFRKMFKTSPVIRLAPQLLFPERVVEMQHWTIAHPVAL